MRDRLEMDTINLDNVALEIARKRLLQGVSYKELAAQYYTSASTIHRRLTAWLKEDRFDLADRLAARKTAFIVGKDDTLAAQLVRKSGIWRARVVRISGVEAAYSEQYLDDASNDASNYDASEAAKAALSAADDLHRCLGEAAAEIVLNSLRKNITIGISSGRGVGFMVEALAENLRLSCSWISGYSGLRLVSLCGGVHTGRWEPTGALSRAFDADENVYALAAALKIPRSEISYTSGPLVTGQPGLTDFPLNLDLAVIGLGQLNTRHHYFRDLIDHKGPAGGGPLEKIIEWQRRNPALCDSLAEIVMKLYPSGRLHLPPDFLDAIQAVTRAVITVSP